MSGEKPGYRRGAVLAFASVFFAFLFNAVIFAKDQPAAQQPITVAADLASPVNTAAVGRVTMSSTYSLVLHRDQTRIKLRGQVPTEEDHKIIVGLVKGSFASLDLVDRIKVGKSAPGANLKVGGLSYALKVLSHLESGSASVNEHSVTVEGAAGNSTVHPALQKTVNYDKPAGVDVKVNITTAVYWRGEIVDDHLIMTGCVVADKNKTNLEAYAHDLFASFQIANQTNLVESAPEDWNFVTTHSLKVLRHLYRGEVHIKDRTIRIEGLVTNKEASDAINSLTEKYPRTYTLESRVNVEPQKAGLLDILESGTNTQP
jgi:hypothetical protein